MRSRLTLSFLALSSLALIPAATFANGKNATAQGEDKSDKVRHLTGCVTKDGDEFRLTTDNGDTWELTGDPNLAEHVGHTIRVTGTVNHAKMHETKEKAKERTQDNPKEHGHLTVTSVKHLSESCSK